MPDPTNAYRGARGMGGRSMEDDAVPSPAPRSPDDEAWDEALKSPSTTPKAVRRGLDSPTFHPIPMPPARR